MGRKTPDDIKRLGQKPLRDTLAADTNPDDVREDPECQASTTLRAAGSEFRDLEEKLKPCRDEGTEKAFLETVVNRLWPADAPSQIPESFIRVVKVLADISGL